MPLRAILQWLWPHEDEAYALMDDLGQELLGGFEEILASIQIGNTKGFEHLRARMLDRKRRIEVLRKLLAESLSHPFMPTIEGEEAIRIARALREVQEHLIGISELLSIYGVPSEADAIRGLAKDVVEAMRLLASLVKYLPKEGIAKAVEEKMEALHQVRIDVDAKFQEALGRLYGIPSDPISLVKTQDLLKRLAGAVDHIQQVAKSIYEAVAFE